MRSTVACENLIVIGRTGATAASSTGVEKFVDSPASDTTLISVEKDVCLSSTSSVASAGATTLLRLSMAGLPQTCASPSHPWQRRQS